MRNTLRVVVITALAAMMIGGGVAEARPDNARVMSGQECNDSATTNGATISLHFVRHGNTLTNVRVGVKMPRSYANRFRAWGNVFVNDDPRAGGVMRTIYDTNGDAFVSIRMQNIRVGNGPAYISGWSSDKLSRYNQAHPACRV
jgi:hypothetical protein